jgi:hypothetical protein
MTDLLRDLARAKATFQRRTLKTILTEGQTMTETDTNEAAVRVSAYLDELQRRSTPKSSSVDPDRIHGLGVDHLLTASDLRALLAARDRDAAVIESAGQVWNPIETAPKNGTKIIVISIESEDVFCPAVAWWDSETERFENGDPYDEWPITHWYAPDPNDPILAALSAREDTDHDQ